jgi:hypothetical protein
MSYVFFMLNEMRWDVIFRFVHIARNVGDHYLIFLFLTLFKVDWLADFINVTRRYQVYKIILQCQKRNEGKFKETNEIIRSRQLKDRQYKGRERDTERTKIIHKTSAIVA